MRRTAIGWRTGLLAALWVAYATLWIGGAVGHILYGGTPAGAAWAAPGFLTLAGAIVLVSSPGDWKALGAAAMAGFVSELIGVHYAIPFGPYRYTQVLQPLIWQVPVVLLFAWMVLIALVREMRIPALAGAAWMTAIDALIDPVASQPLGYWIWLTPGPYFGVPLLNFAGWFVVSAAILAALPGRGSRNGSVQTVGLTVILFFAIVALAHRLYLPAAIGLVQAVIAFRLLRPAKREEHPDTSS